MPDASPESLQRAAFSSATRKGGRTPRSGCPVIETVSASVLCAIRHCSPMGATMPDLSQALAVLRSMRTSMSPQVPALGTGWERENTLATKPVPIVPDVPAQNEARQVLSRTACLDDVLE